MKNKPQSITTIAFIAALFCFTIAKAEWTKPAQKGVKGANSSFAVSEMLRFACKGKYIYKTTDGGVNWQLDSLTIDTKDKFVLPQIAFVNAKIGYILIIGKTKNNIYENILYKTIDTGKSWLVLTYLNTLDFTAVLTPINTNEMIIASEKTGLHLLYSNNSGSIWVNLSTYLPDSGNFKIKIKSDSVWYLASLNGLYNSMNKGSNWALVTKTELYFASDSSNFHFISHVNIADFQILDNQINILYDIYYAGCGSYYDHSVLLRYSNYKNNGERDTFPEIRLEENSKICFIGKDTGYIFSNSGIFKTFDGGKSWFKVYTNSDADGYFSHYASGNGILWMYTTTGVLIKNNNFGSDRNLIAEFLNKSNSVIDVFPNPSNAEVNFKWMDNKTGTWILKLYDINGRMCFESLPIDSKAFKLEISQFPKGIFTYEIVAENKYIFGKLIVN